MFSLGAVKWIPQVRLGFGVRTVAADKAAAKNLAHARIPLKALGDAGMLSPLLGTERPPARTVLQLRTRQVQINAGRPPPDP
jgi:hypothetical protein